MSRPKTSPLRPLPIIGGIILGVTLPILLNLSAILNAATNLLPVLALQIVGYVLYFIIGLILALIIRRFPASTIWVLLTMTVLFTIGLFIPGNAIQDVLTFSGAVIGAIHHMPTNPVNFLVAGVLLYVAAGNYTSRRRYH